MKLKNSDKIFVVEKIYQKILGIYPFLTKTEKNIFKKKAKFILDKSKCGKSEQEISIKNLLALLNSNGHADIKEWRKSDRNFMRKAKIKKSPFSKIENRILYIKIPSWAKWLGDIDQKLNKFCQKNIKKYNAIIIDVRENQGGSSRIAHNFAGIFFKKTFIYGKFIKKNENGKLKTTEGRFKPNKKIFIDQPIIILISRKCFSSNELFLAPFKILKRAVLIGEPTAGGSANPISEIVEIFGKKFIIRIPTWRFFLKDKKQPIEKTKISPDIVYKGKNIEKFAKNYLLKNNK
ncbi:MAG: S41 family peptidase [Patescibacteria group bacterium]|nr:S41 family peptidase [Patescibacteria group bacterium]MDD5164357.1 S41 family peptidase [Patescibacteria group bacterium]MDD5534275.1 S41 family peptidase [Patescibacteria group bacterium]